MISHKGARAMNSRSSDFFVRITDYSDGILTGSIEHSSSGDFLYFRGLTSMLNAIEEKLNESGFPQAAMAIRTWDLPTSPVLEEDSSGLGLKSEDAGNSLSQASTRAYPAVMTEPDMVFKPHLASFILRVQFRQNASWQGSLSWIENKSAITFRSELELIRLIDTALQHACEQNRVITVPRPEYKWTVRKSVS